MPECADGETDAVQPATAHDAFRSEVAVLAATQGPPEEVVDNRSLRRSSRT